METIGFIVAILAIFFAGIFLTLANFRAKNFAVKIQKKINSGQFKEVLLEVDKAIEKHPNNIQFRLNRAQVYLNMKQFNEALSDCNYVIGQKDTFALAYYIRGAAYLGVGKLGEALQDFDKAIRLQPDLAMAYIGRLEVYVRSGDTHAAKLEQEQLLEKIPHRFETHFGLGVVNFNSGNYEEAIKFFNKALDYEQRGIDQRYRLYTYRCWSYIRLRNFEAAMADVKQMNRLEPQNPYGMFSAIYIQFGGKEYELAEKRLRELLRTHSHFPEAIDLLWQVLIQLQKLDEALELSQQLLEQDQTSAQYIFMRGHVYMQMGKHEKAMKDFDRAIEIEPHNALAYNDRAWSKASVSDYAGALEDSDIAIELLSDQSNFYDTRGQAKWLLGDYEGALADYQKAAQMDNNFGIYFLGQAAALYKLNRTDEAIEAWQKLAEFDDEAQTAGELQEKYRFAEPFYQALKEIESLAKD